MTDQYLTHRQITAERKKMVEAAHEHLDRVTERVARSLGQERRHRNEEFYRQLQEKKL